MIDERIPIADETSKEPEIAQIMARIFTVPRILETIRQSLTDQERRLAQLEKLLTIHAQSNQALEGSIKSLTAGMEAFYQRQQCLEQASQRLTQLSQQHYEHHIIEPLSRSILSVVDMLRDASKNSNGQKSDLVEAIEASLHELLAAYGIKKISVAIGSDFDAKIMQPVRMIGVCQQRYDKKVEAVIRHGYRCNERILRPSMVSIYRFENPKEIRVS